MGTWDFAPQPDFAAGELLHVSVTGPAGGGDGITLDLLLRDSSNNDTNLGSVVGDQFDYEFDVTIPADAMPAAGYKLVTTDGTNETASPAFTIGAANSRAVLERSARNVHATLAGAGLGLKVRRRSWTGDEPIDGLCVIHIGDGQEQGETEGAPAGILYWRESIALEIWLLEQETNSAGSAAAASPSMPIDERIGYVFGQVCKNLLTDRQRGGNADNTVITAFSPFNPAELAHPGFVLAFDIVYSHGAADPNATV